MNIYTLITASQRRYIRSCFIECHAPYLEGALSERDIYKQTTHQDRHPWNPVMRRSATQSYPALSARIVEICRNARPNAFSRYVVPSYPSLCVLLPPMHSSSASPSILCPTPSASLLQFEIAHKRCRVMIVWFVDPRMMAVHASLRRPLRKTR